MSKAHLAQFVLIEKFPDKTLLPVKDGTAEFIISVDSKGRG